MKYVVYWIFIKMSIAECPQKAEFEKFFGKGYYCGVGHYKNEEIKDSAWYWSRSSAYQRYLDMNAEYEKSCIMVSTGSNSQQPMHLFPQYIDIRYDSIAPVAKLSKPKVK